MNFLEIMLVVLLSVFISLVAELILLCKKLCTLLLYHPLLNLYQREEREDQPTTTTVSKNLPEEDIPATQKDTIAHRTEQDSYDEL